MNTRLDTVREEVAVARHGQSAYSEPGVRSGPQRGHDGLAALQMVEKVARREGYVTGYEAGHKAGHKAGRRSVWQLVGPERLIVEIERDLEAARRMVAR